MRSRAPGVISISVSVKIYSGVRLDYVLLWMLFETPEKQTPSEFYGAVFFWRTYHPLSCQTYFTIDGRSVGRS
jgi:hypothetical protein